jgi:hypothetical protein
MHPSLTYSTLLHLTTPYYITPHAALHYSTPHCITPHHTPFCQVPGNSGQAYLPRFPPDDDVVVPPLTAGLGVLHSLAVHVNSVTQTALT